MDEVTVLFRSEQQYQNAVWPKRKCGVRAPFLRNAGHLAPRVRTAQVMEYICLLSTQLAGFAVHSPLDSACGLNLSQCWQRGMSYA